MPEVYDFLAGTLVRHLQQVGAQNDGIQWIPEVVRHDRHHVVASPHGLIVSLVDTEESVTVPDQRDQNANQKKGNK